MLAEPWHPHRQQEYMISLCETIKGFTINEYSKDLFLSALPWKFVWEWPYRINKAVTKNFIS